VGIAVVVVVGGERKREEPEIKRSKEKKQKTSNEPREQQKKGRAEASNMLTILTKIPPPPTTRPIHNHSSIPSINNNDLPAFPTMAQIASSRPLFIICHVPYSSSPYEAKCTKGNNSFILCILHPCLKV
jgi:hypothetical protein